MTALFFLYYTIPFISCPHCLNKKNPFWQESINLYANLLENSRNNEILTRSKINLVYLYNSVGRSDKAVEIAKTFSAISYSSEIMLFKATYGEERCKYAQKALVNLLGELYSAVSEVIFSRYQINSKDDFANLKKRAEKICGMANLFELIFDDGNMGSYHGTVCDIYCWLASMYCGIYSDTSSENGDKSRYIDLSFECLDKALENAKKFDSQLEVAEYKYTAFLVNLVTDTYKQIPLLLPKAVNIMNTSPVMFENIKKVLIHDKRWQIWIDKING